GYLGTNGIGVSRNHGADVRKLLNRLDMFAARHDLVVSTLAHLNKATVGSSISRMSCAQEWASAPRAILLVTEEPGTGRRLLVPLKSNIGPDHAGFAFEIESKVIAEGICTSAVVWSDDPVTISADEALATATKRVTSGAVDFLQAALR